jgi:hypothetical protein
VIVYAKFTDEVVAVIVSTGQSVEYCFLSERLRDVKGMEWLKKGDLLPRRSATAKFNRDAENVADGRREEGASDLDDWFDGAPEVEMNEDVVGLGNYGKTLTVLFTDEALDDEEDEDDEDREDDD